MYMQALGIYMVYTWYIPCIIFIGVPDVHDGRIQMMPGTGWAGAARAECNPLSARSWLPYGVRGSTSQPHTHADGFLHRVAGLQHQPLKSRRSSATRTAALLQCRSRPSLRRPASNPRSRESPRLPPEGPPCHGKSASPAHATVV